MNKILLLTHFGWGSTLLKGVEMIIGNVDFVDEIALKPAMTSAEYSSQVESFIESNGYVYRSYVEKYRLLALKVV